jgi:hypothetical protein
MKLYSGRQCVGDVESACLTVPISYFENKDDGFAFSKKVYEFLVNSHVDRIIVTNHKTKKTWQTTVKNFTKNCVLQGSDLEQQLMLPYEFWNIKEKETGKLFEG